MALRVLWEEKRTLKTRQVASAPYLC